MNDTLPPVAETPRVPKIVETIRIGLADFSDQVSVIGRVGPLREATVSTLGTGFIGAVMVETWDRVSSWQVLASIADTYGLTGYSLDAAEIAVTSAGLTRESTLATLDQSLYSARLAYEKAQKDFTAARLVNVGEEPSQAQLDYENYITSQEKTIAGYETTYGTLVQSLQAYITNVVETVDTLMGVSLEKQSGNDSYEYLLSALDSEKKNTAEGAIRELLVYKNWTPNLSLPLLARIREMETVYSLVNTVLSSVEIVLIKSVTDSSNFSEATRTALRAQIDGYQAQYSASTGSLVTYYNSSQTFLATYEKDRLSREKSLQTAQNNAQRALDLSKSAYDTAQKSRDIAISQMEQSLKTATLGQLNATGNAAKMSVTAPFSGVVISRNAEIGNLVTPGIALFTLGDISRMMVTVDVSVMQQKYLSIGDTIPLYFGGKNIIGTLSTLSAWPDARTQLYKAQIALPLGHTLSLWDIVEVVLPGKTLTKSDNNGQIVLPFSALKNIGQETYLVYVFTPDEGTINTGVVHERIVKIGDKNEGSVTIVDWLTPWERIVSVGTLGVDDGDYVRDPSLSTQVLPDSSPPNPL